MTPHTSRGLGVSQQDLDASRLVFVSVKDAKPKRKVAVPIPEGGNWESFCRSVQTKLKLVGIETVYLASSGERVASLDSLQDIDELYVVESSHPSSSNGYTSVNHVHRVGISDTEITAALSGQLDADADDDTKYAKRQGSIQRTMKRVFPGLFRQTSLPITNRDLSLSPVEQVRRRVRRRRKSWTDPRSLLVLFALISCLATAFFVYSRVSFHGLP